MKSNPIQTTALIVSRAFSLFLLGCCAGLLMGCSDSDYEPLPDEAIDIAASSDNTIVAYLLKWKPPDGIDPLGSDTRYYLALTFQDSSIIITRDLSEGYGDYESEVSSIRWLDDHRIVVERYIADKRTDIVFDIQRHSWSEFEHD